ncbi:MAG: hypothetical protein NDJ92_18435 [Thermoanaerobaculia bacterium]|nr:hypothetical protein [Thermoanaerobaculia bacterium]
MPNLVKYLVTVDADTGIPVKCEQVGDAGQLTEVSMQDVTPQVAVPSAGGTVIVNIYTGGGQVMTHTQPAAEGVKRTLFAPGIILGGTPSAPDAAKRTLSAPGIILGGTPSTEK